MFVGVGGCRIYMISCVCICVVIQMFVGVGGRGKGRVGGGNGEEQQLYVLARRGSKASRLTPQTTNTHEHIYITDPANHQHPRTYIYH